MPRADSSLADRRHLELQNPTQAGPTPSACDVRSQRRLQIERGAVDAGHESSDAAGHAPGGLVGHAELLLQFGGGHAVAGGGEQIDRIEPELQRGSAVGKRRAGGRVEMMTAPLAGTGALGVELVPSAAAFTARAAVSLRVTDREDVSEADLVVGEHLEELFEGDDPVGKHEARLIPGHGRWQPDTGHVGWPRRRRRIGISALAVNPGRWYKHQ